MSTPAAPAPRRLWLRVLLTVLICLLAYTLLKRKGTFGGKAA